MPLRHCLRGDSRIDGGVRFSPLAVEKIWRDTSQYDELDRAEDRMWWFAAMHANLLMAAQRSGLEPLDLPMLDAGCGTGGFFRGCLRNTAADP